MEIRHIVMDAEEISSTIDSLVENGKIAMDVKVEGKGIG